MLICSCSLCVLSSDLTHLLVCELRGFAPRYARFTLAFLPSMMGFASLHARSAAPLSTMVTCWHNHSIAPINISLVKLLKLHGWNESNTTAPMKQETPEPGRPWGSCCPCLSLNDSTFLLKVWGDTGSILWRQQSVCFKASSGAYVGGRFVFTGIYLEGVSWGVGR